jgi:iron-sulfur cluster repair protein YtfE (RIC family)
LTVENILVSDHDDLDQLLAEALRASDRDDPGQAFLSVDLFWARLAMHIRAEHLHVFPALLGTSGSPDFQILIAELKKDHDFFMRELAGIIKSLRNIDDASKNISAELKSRLVMIAERLAAHNESEERVIYPTAAQLESAQLISMVEKELKNMPPRFSKAE